jgi:hypothetical protein
MIEVETAHAFDAEQLRTYDDVRAIDQPGPRRFLITVDDAGKVLPEIDDWVAAHGGEYESAREYRPSFDEVFAALVERDARDYETARTGEPAA